MEKLHPGSRGLLIIFLASFYSSLYADHHTFDDALATGAVGIINLVAHDPSAYVASQKLNGETFEQLGVTVAGVCTAVSGNQVPGEMQFFSFVPSIADAMQVWDTMSSSASIRQLQDELSANRALTGNETWQIIDGYSGEVRDTWATRLVSVNPTNTQEYIAAIKALESSYHENGYEDIEFDVYQPIGSGSQSLLNVVAVAPSLYRLGEAFDVLNSESWSQEAYALATALRPVLVSDKIYKCEQVYSSL